MISSDKAAQASGLLSWLIFWQDPTATNICTAAQTFFAHSELNFNPGRICENIPDTHMREDNSQHKRTTDPRCR